MPQASRSAEGPRGGTLRRRAQFREVVEGGRRAPGKRVLLYVLPGESGPRAGFVCGRGVGNAVGRNRARRLLREAWRTLSPRLREGVDIVVVALPSIRGAKTQEVVADMAATLRSAGVMRP